MASITQLTDVLEKFFGLLQDMPEKKDKLAMPGETEPKLKILVALQKNYGTTVRLSEILDRLSSSKDGEIENNIIERVRFLVTKMMTEIKSMPPGTMDIVVYFLPQDFKSEKIYIENLEKSRPAEKIQSIKEDNNFFEVLSKVSESFQLAFLRGIMTLACYPQDDISKEVVVKVR
jgi:hypothetical protein